MEKVRWDGSEEKVMWNKKYTLEEAINLIESNIYEDGVTFIREQNLPVDVVGGLIKKYSLFLGPMSPDHFEFKIYNKFGVVENNNWSPINEETMPNSWREKQIKL